MNTEVKRTVRHVPFTEQQRPAPASQRRAWGKLALRIFLGVLLVAAIAGIIAYQTMFAAIKRSEPYRLAMQQVQQDRNLIAALGDPIEDVTWFPLGKTFTTEHGTEAMHVDFRVGGPKAHATIQLDAERRDGRWLLTKVVGTPDGGRPMPIELSEEASGLEKAPEFDGGAGPVRPPQPPAKTEAPPQIELPEIPGM